MGVSFGDTSYPMAELTPEVLATLFGESSEPVFVYSPLREGGRVVDFRFLYANQAALQLVSAPIKQNLARGLLAVAPDVERWGLLTAYIRTMESGEPTNIRIDADSGPVKGSFRVHASRAGEALLIHLRDVTQEAQTQAALQKTEAERDQTENRRAALEVPPGAGPGGDGDF